MSLCPTFERSLQDRIPAPVRKMQYESRHEAAVVVGKRGKVLLRQCQPDERWAGLWDFPRYVLGEEDNGSSPTDHLTTRLRDDLGMTVDIGRRLATIRHAVTKYRIKLDCFAADWIEGRLPRGAIVWTPVSKLSGYPLSVTGRKITRLLGS